MSSMDRAKELMQEVITFFAANFLEALTQVIVKKCETEAASAGALKEEEYELESAPTPFEPLKTGIMTKKGGFFKNWKERFFIVHNEKDNWVIKYFDKEGGAMKGQVAPCGYQAELFTEEDDKQEGTVKDKEFGVKLVPYSKDRRTWYFKATSKEDQEKWLEHFKTCCWKAGPQRNENELIADAFDIAYWNTRWQFSLWGSYTAWGTEDERLADLVMCIIEREVIYPEFAALTVTGFARNAAENAIRTPISAMVKAAAGSQWTASTGLASAAVDTVKEQVQTNIAPIIDAKQNMKKGIVDAVNGVVQPVLGEKAGSVLQPILSKACAPIGKAFAKFTVDFKDKMTEKLGNGELSDSKFESGMRSIEYGMYWTMYQAYDIVYDMCFNGLADLMNLIPGVSMNSVYYMCRDSMNTIHYNAAYTFKKYAKESGNYEPASLETVLAATMRKMVHDCKLASKNLVVEFLRLLIDTPVQELMLKPAKTLVSPMQAQIDAIPVVNKLLNLNEMTTECIERIVKDTMSTIVQTGFISQMGAEFAAIKL